MLRDAARASLTDSGYIKNVNMAKGQQSFIKSCIWGVGPPLQYYF